MQCLFQLLPLEICVVFPRLITGLDIQCDNFLLKQKHELCLLINAVFNAGFVMLVA